MTIDLDRLPKIPMTINHTTAEAAQRIHTLPQGWEWATILMDDACEDCKQGRYVGYDHPECCAATVQRKERGY